MADHKYLVCKTEGFNIYKSVDDYGRLHFYAYLNREQVAEEMFLATDRVTFDRCLDFFVHRVKEKIS